MSTSSESPLLQVTGIRYAVLGLAWAPIFMAFFGAMWWGMGDWQLPAIIFFSVLGSAVAVLVVGAIVLVRGARQLPIDPSPEVKAMGTVRGRRYGRWFGIIFGSEFVAIAIVNRVLYAVAHHPELSQPLIAIIVGIHFLPLAYLFDVKAYYVTGSLMTLAAIIIMIAVPVTRMFGEARAWDVVLGAVCAVVLWLTGVYTLFLGRQWLTKARLLLPLVAPTIPSLYRGTE